ncbi:cytochrome c oxidase subunit 1 [Apophysomyces ossiformis]|uniref:Cytochrome c oxidase subunit 1 n=1 Tax=Apophysomyces ossiformis TaxID=679940 RepID=A0A8H7C0Z0_9FUNG|nr:cytochrome c oxidase subunit 1 [Apophysomyces ossiformis]
MAIVEEIQDEPVKKQCENVTVMDDDVFYDTEEYQPEELERLMNEANEYKLAGNKHFAVAKYDDAIHEYENALMTCPLSQPKERAVYFANIAACQLKMEKYKEARDMCTQALKLDPQYQKALLRRAQANERIGSYTSLSDALEDYKRLQTLADTAYTRNQCEDAQRRLPPRIKTQMEKEKEEMLGKLKDLGNTVLGKFGLSTDNFQFQKDPNSGGYSVNFVNNAQSSSS